MSRTWFSPCGRCWGTTRDERRRHPIPAHRAVAGFGLGHVSRCLALGRAAVALGARVSLVAGPDACAASLVRSAALETIAVPTVNGQAAVDRLGDIDIEVDLV